jgi:hypothetical protein
MYFLNKEHTIIVSITFGMVVFVLFAFGNFEESETSFKTLSEELSEKCAESHQFVFLYEGSQHQVSSDFQ